MKAQVFLFLALAGPVVLAEGKRAEHGLVGYGIVPFKPTCAFACRDAIAGATLNCSMTESMKDMAGMDMGSMVMTDPECYATDDAFLQTLAWCISSRCKDVTTWKLERFWQRNVAGTTAVQPDPKETYQKTVNKIQGTPSTKWEEGSLNQTSLVPGKLWFAAYNTDTIFGDQETMQEGYGLIILLSGVIIPIAFSLLRFIPFPGALRSKFNAWFIDPPLFGTKHDTLIFFGLTQMPKRGQALFIFYFIVINNVFCAVNYEYASPNVWYPDDKFGWMCMLIGNRIGLLSFANMPLVFLYAGRNNLLLWVTNWSHSTFLLLHRWIAGIATLQAILHSIIYLHVYFKRGTHATESKEPYWYWGIIATLGMTILFPASLVPIRKKAYELFLAWHVFISILVVAGCYWHVVFEFEHAWGYETWIIICMAIWAFDRVFRALRLARYGIKMAHIAVVDDEYIRVTIPDVYSSGHAYLYFPTLTWRVWENHPFSIASTILPSTTHSEVKDTSRSNIDIEKVSQVYESNSQHSGPSNSHNRSPQVGITFYIRTQTGLTSILRGHTSLPILIEAGYSQHPPSSCNTSPTIIALAGGVGITATLPHLRTHPGRAKLYWGCRTQALIEDVNSTHALSGVEKEFFVGKRMVVQKILDNELTRDARGEVCVLVSGPEGMIDEVRNVVGEIVKKESGVKVKLVVESFSW